MTKPIMNDKAVVRELALPPTADRERRVEIPLIIGKLENGVSEAGVVRLPQAHIQLDPQQIAIEAEEATAISFADNIFSDPEGLRGADPEASGGRFICRITWKSGTTVTRRFGWTI